MSRTPQEIVDLAEQLFPELVNLARQAKGGWEPAMVEDVDGEYYPSPPNDQREVLVFLNGHCDISDHGPEGRKGGGWGRRFGWFDHDRGCWRVGGKPNGHVTHWQELPPAPERKP